MQVKVPLHKQEAASDFTAEKAVSSVFFFKGCEPSRAKALPLTWFQSSRFDLSSNGEAADGLQSNGVGYKHTYI